MHFSGVTAKINSLPLHAQSPITITARSSNPGGTFRSGVLLEWPTGYLDVAVITSTLRITTHEGSLANQSVPAVDPDTGAELKFKWADETLTLTKDGVVVATVALGIEFPGGNSSVTFYARDGAVYSSIEIDQPAYTLGFWTERVGTTES